MAQRMCGAVLTLLLLLGVQVGESQVRQISGRVTASQTEQGLADVSVSVTGTGISVQTGNDGRYTLNAPDRELTLVFRGIGYKRQTVVVPVDQSAADVSLEADPFKLEELVVTGQSTGIERQNLPNAVATVGADELTRAPTSTLESALQGKIPGALIQANSGAPGGGIQVNLRGVSTITSSPEPLWVVDGIVVSNDAIPNGQNAISCAQCAGNPRNQDNPTNRIADLNPEDIERIEVLKGGSAAAIYGSKATNGVIIITTKHGTTGKPQFSFTQRLGTAWKANELGTRTFTSLDEAVSVFGPNAANYFQPGRVFDHEDELYGRHGLSYETSANVSGGTDQTKYYVSGLVKNDEGIATNTGYKKQGVRVNLDQQMSGWLQLSANTNVTHSRSRRGLSNNDNTSTSPYVAFSSTPSFVDLQATNGGKIAADFPSNPFANSNPLQTFTFLKSEEDTWRAFGTVTAKATLVARPHHTWQLIAIGGADYFEQDNNLISPPELQYEPLDGQPGTAVVSKSSNRNLNLAVNSNYTYLPASEKFQSTLSAGVQYEDRFLNATQILARTLLSGQENPDQATSASISQDNRLVRDLGLYGQEELLLLNRRLLLTAGLRADRSSNDGNTSKFFLYPKAAVSYRVIKPFGGLDEIKLRGAFGQTGNLPVFGTKFSPDTTGTIGGLFGVLPGNEAGDPNIRPERQTEFETGFDATLGNGRAELNVTVYQRTIKDLRLAQTLAPSTGQETRVFTSDSRLRNRGVELSLGVSPVRTRDVNWFTRGTFFLNRSKITRLSVPAFETGGFGTSLGAFLIKEGSSATQIVGREGVVGDATPNFQVSLSNDLTYHQLSLGFLWDWKQGGDIINLTQFLYDLSKNSPDYLSAGAERLDRWSNGETKVYVQDGSYLKLREVTLAYTLPDRFTRALFGGGLRYARLSLSGRNLIRFTGYPGLDPEVSNFANQAIVRNIDVAPFPPNKSFLFGIDLGL